MPLKAWTRESTSLRWKWSPVNRDFNYISRRIILYQLYFIYELIMIVPFTYCLSYLMVFATCAILMILLNIRFEDARNFKNIDTRVDQCLQKWPTLPINIEEIVLSHYPQLRITYLNLSSVMILRFENH